MCWSGALAGSEAGCSCDMSDGVFAGRSHSYGQPSMSLRSALRQMVIDRSAAKEIFGRGSFGRAQPYFGQSATNYAYLPCTIDRS